MYNWLWTIVLIGIGVGSRSSLIPVGVGSVPDLVGSPTVVLVLL